MSDDYLSEFALRRNLPVKYLCPTMLAAVRGPDDWAQVDASEVKYELTGRIRAILFGQYPGVFTSYPMTVEGFSNIKTALENIPDSFHHFLAHLEMAIFACQDEAVWGGYGKELFQILTYKVRN